MPCFAPQETLKRVEEAAKAADDEEEDDEDEDEDDDEDEEWGDATTAWKTA